VFLFLSCALFPVLLLSCSSQSSVACAISNTLFFPGNEVGDFGQDGSWIASTSDQLFCWGNTVSSAAVTGLDEGTGQLGNPLLRPDQVGGDVITVDPPNIELDPEPNRRRAVGGNTLVVPSTVPVVSSCGNGQKEAGEDCDDGNLLSGDGCEADCIVQAGYECNLDDSGRSICQSCGNGVLEGTESCDDGNRVSGDGCSATCETEEGWTGCNSGDGCQVGIH
jgi:cysteine-rich repeat protein